MTEADNKEAFATRPAPVRFLLLLACYAAAIFVSCIVSFATLFLGMVPFCLVLASLEWLVGHETVATNTFLTGASLVAMGLVFVAVGFFGVASGTLCLPERARRFGSSFLLFLGLAYGVYLIVVIGSPHEVGIFPFMWLIFLALGGILATAFQKKALHLIWGGLGSLKSVFGWKRDTAAWPGDY